MSAPGSSPGRSDPVTPAQRRRVVALAAPRFFAWLIDVALFALVVVLLVQLDGLIFGGELGLNESYQSEQRLIEEMCRREPYARPGIGREAEIEIPLGQTASHSA